VLAAAVFVVSVVIVAPAVAIAPPSCLSRLVTGMCRDMPANCV
jgi:hypothetical protein